MSGTIKRSSISLIVVLAVAVVLCVCPTTRVIGATNASEAKPALDESALLQSVLADDAKRSQVSAAAFANQNKATNGSTTVTNISKTAGTNASVVKAESRKHKILKFLFDGVPAEGVTNKVVTVVHQRETQRRRPSVISAFRFGLVTMTNVVVHPPFAKNDCAQCHGGSSQNPVLKAPQRQLCLQCHQKTFAQPVAFEHKPVAAGECARCHDPHKSPNKKLLRKTGNALCVTCHKDKDASALGPVVHTPLQNEGCIECHLPHGGPNKFITRKAGQDLCYDCHDDFATKGKFVHAPVQSGDCTVCHNPHSTQFQKLLRHKGADTCFECHDDFQTGIKTAKFVHAPMQDGDCTMCHDPHATNERAMLKKSVVATCTECHEEKDLAIIKGHADAQGKSCAECHNPHFSEQPHLLKPDRIFKQLTAK